MYDRFLIARAPGERSYEICKDGVRVAAFITASVNGKTPDDTAFGNLLDYSEHHDGEFELRRVDHLYSPRWAPVVLGTAKYGCGREAQPVPVNECSCEIEDDGDPENGPHISMTLDPSCSHHGRFAMPGEWAAIDGEAQPVQPKGVGNTTGYGGHLTDGGF